MLAHLPQNVLQPCVLLRDSVDAKSLLSDSHLIHCTAPVSHVMPHSLLMGKQIAGTYLREDEREGGSYLSLRKGFPGPS